MIFHALGDCKIPDITRNRVELLRDLSRKDILNSVPRILGVDILRMSVSLHLDVSRHPDVRPASAVVVSRLKFLNRFPVILRIGKLPHSAQQITAVRLFPCFFGLTLIEHVIRMRRETILAKDPWVFYYVIIKFCHFLIPSVLTLYSDYLTAPVIPSANCFCSTKKMIIVGMEQKSTPSISTP